MPKEKDHNRFQGTRIYPALERHDHVQHNHIQPSISTQSVNYSNDYTSEAVPRVNPYTSSSTVIKTQPAHSKTQIIKTRSNAIHQYPETVRQQNAPIIGNQSKNASPSSVQPHYLPANRCIFQAKPGETDTIDDNQNKPNGSMKNQMQANVSKTTSKVCLSLALTLGLAISIIVTLMVLLIYKQDSSSYTSSSFTQLTCGTNCMMTLTPYHAETIASWPFNNNLFDLNNIYSGTYVPSATPTYIAGNINQALYFDGGHYVDVATNFLNLTYQSWTIEGWIMVTDLTSERGIFSQCQSPTITDQCLTISIRNKRLYFSFYNDDLMGATFFTVSKWYHVAFVYDYSLMQQSIYCNGILDATTWGSQRLAGPYQGTTGDTFIGQTVTGSYFLGYMEDLQVSSGAKTSCEILNDATLTAYYSFDNGDSNLDLSNNDINGNPNSLSSVSGRVNQAYLFQGTMSYFQSTGFIEYGAGEAFTVALWVKPYSISSGTLIHLSTSVYGGGTACFDLLGFSTTGQLIANLYSTYVCCLGTCSCHYSTSIGGPIMQVNTWTHIVLTYSSINGMSLYTNETLRVFNDAFASFPSNIYAFTSQPYMTVGNPTTTGALPTGCLTSAPALSQGPYQGIIDELRIYSRELTITEICSLFNP